MIHDHRRRIELADIVPIAFSGNGPLLVSESANQETVAIVEHFREVAECEQTGPKAEFSRARLVVGRGWDRGGPDRTPLEKVALVADLFLMPGHHWVSRSCLAI